MTPRRKNNGSLSLTRLAKSFGEQFSESSVSMLANGMVYSTLIAVVPCLAVIYTVLNLFNVLDPFVALLEEWIIQTFGSGTGASLVNYIRMFTQNAMGMGIISILSFGVTFILLVDKLFTCVNKIYHTSNGKNIALRYVKYTGIILASLLVMVGLVLFIVRFNSLSLKMRDIDMSGIQKVTNKLIPVGLLFGLLLLINLFVPNCKVRFKSALIGAIAGTVGLGILLFIFQFVVQRSVKYSVIYGSLATLMFFFLFLAYMWKILFGAITLAYVHQSQTVGVEYHI